MSDFLMPSLGADMESATVVEWTVQPGSEVKRGDIIAVVETDKGAIEIEIFKDGVIDQILVQAGQTVTVNTVLATLLESGEERPAVHEPLTPTTLDKVAVAPLAARSPASMNGADERARPPRVKISPLARRRAAELGVDIDQLHGSGLDGAITASDVSAAAAERAGAAVPAKTRPPVMQTMRASIGQAMARSKREIPHYYLSTTIDMSRALTWMEARNRELPVAERMLYSVLLLKAVAMALERFPELNGRWEDGAFVSSESINLGMAIALRQGGLIAPALLDANELDLPALMSAFRDLVSRARSQKLRASELSSPSMTVTNLGEQGVEVVLPVIYPPQVAIVGFGSVIQRPWVVEGQIEVRQVVVASLAADHRASDGRRGALFLGTLAELLQRPEAL